MVVPTWPIGGGAAFRSISAGLTTLGDLWSASAIWMAPDQKILTFHCLRIGFMFPCGFTGNLSLLEIHLCFPGTWANGGNPLKGMQPSAQSPQRARGLRFDAKCAVSEFGFSFQEMHIYFHAQSSCDAQYLAVAKLVPSFMGIRVRKTTVVGGSGW